MCFRVRELQHTKITVAAVIPLYNGAEFIREALESVLNQTVAADEVIVVDDGSTDGGAAIVEEIARTRPVTLLRKPNGGQSSARNMAIRHTRCTHVAFLDQDDAWYENHLAVLKRPFQQGRSDHIGLVYGNLDWISRNGWLVEHGCLDVSSSPHPKRSLRDCLRHDMFILPGASLASRQAMLDAGLFDERLSGYEDDDLFLRMFVRGVDLIYLNVVVTRWRIYSGSTSFSPRMARSRMIYFHKLVETFPDEPRIGFFPTRDAIAARFLEILANEFVAASRAGERERLSHAWAGLQQVIPVAPRKVQYRMRLLRPIIAAFSRGPLSGLSRAAVRFVARDVLRERQEEMQRKMLRGVSLSTRLRAPGEHRKNAPL